MVDEDDFLQQNNEELDGLLENIDQAVIEKEHRDEFMLRLDIVAKRLEEKGASDEQINQVIEILIEEFNKKRILVLNLKE
jgi:hypothetical protein